MEQTNTNISDLVRQQFEKRQEAFKQQLENAPNKEHCLELEIKRIHNIRFSDWSKQREYFYKQRLATYYNAGWDNAERGVCNSVEKGFFAFAPNVYVEGVADAMFYHWLKKEQKNASEKGCVTDFAKLGQPIFQWNLNTNVLHAMVFDFLEAGVISLINTKTNGDGKAEMVRFFVENFVDKNGKQLSKTSFEQALKPEEYDRRAKRDKIDVSKILPPAKKNKKT